MMESSLIQSLVMAVAIGVASGAIGSFILLKRMALVSDALSHVALPGIALALLYGYDPFYGVLVFLLAGVLLVWTLEMRTRLPAEAIVGLLFTASLAIGILLIPNDEIIHSLFGEFPMLPLPTLMFLIVCAVFITFFAFRFSRSFLFAVISPDVAQVDGIGRKHHLLLLILFAGVVSLGIKLVGTLLMGALTILPAAIVKNVASSMREYIAGSAILGGILSFAGILISYWFGFLPGPTIILLGVFLFALTLMVVRP